MKSSRLLDRRVGFSLASLGMLLGVVSPAVVPVLASAAQISSRSVALSDATADASGVAYKVTFTTVGAAGAFVLDFCDDSPIYGQSCHAPAGFSGSSAATATSGATIGTLTTPAANKIEVVKTMGATTAVTVDLTAIHNPTGANDETHGFYARIVTFDTDSDAQAYASTGANTGKIDDGGVALSITDAIGVTAAVRETMTFCVSGQAPDADCGSGITAPAAGSVISPSLTLGEGTGSAKALDASHLSTGDDWAQISTNALHGAVVSLKTNRSCGGLARSDAPTDCAIAPKTGTPGFSYGEAFFGLKLGTPGDAANASAPEGTIAPESNYSDYFMDYNSSAPTTAGVSGTYGSPLFNTSGAPISNQNIQMTFGASVSNTTPAGLYGANLSLIATGTY